MRHWRLMCKSKWEAVNTWTVMLQSDTEPLSQPSVVPLQRHTRTRLPSIPLLHISPLSESYLSSRHHSYSYFWLFNALPHSRYSWAPLKPLQIQYQHSHNNSCSVSLFLLQSASSGWLITDTESSDFWTSRLHEIIPFKHLLKVYEK